MRNLSDFANQDLQTLPPKILNKLLQLRVLFFSLFQDCSGCFEFSSQASFISMKRRCGQLLGRGRALLGINSNAPSAVSLACGQASARRVWPSRLRRCAAPCRDGDSPSHCKVSLSSNTRSNKGRIRCIPAPLAESSARRRRTRIGQAAAGETSAIVRGQVRHSVRRLPTREARQATSEDKTLAGLLFRATGHGNPERRAI